MFVLSVVPPTGAGAAEVAKLLSAALSGVVYEHDSVNYPNGIYFLVSGMGAEYRIFDDPGLPDPRAGYVIVKWQDKTMEERVRHTVDGLIASGCAVSVAINWYRHSERWEPVADGQDLIIDGND